MASIEIQASSLTARVGLGVRGDDGGGVALGGDGGAVDMANTHKLDR